MRHCLQQKKNIYRSTESLRTVTKNFSHTIKQLFHQYHKILALCNIKGELD